MRRWSAGTEHSWPAPAAVIGARRGDGIAEHDPRDWLEGMVVSGQEAVAGAGDVRISAIGVAALGPAPLLVDASSGTADQGAALRSRPPRRASASSHDSRPGYRRGGGDARQRAAEARLVAGERAGCSRLGQPGPWTRPGFLVATLTGVPVMDTVTAADYAAARRRGALPASRPGRPAGGGGGAARPAPREQLGLPAGAARGRPAPMTPSSTSPPRGCGSRATPESCSGAR